MMPSYGPNLVSFNKTKLKIGRPKHSLTPHPIRPITYHFCLTLRPSPPPSSPPALSPSLSGRHMCITPNVEKFQQLATIKIFRQRVSAMSLPIIKSCLILMNSFFFTIL